MAVMLLAGCDFKGNVTYSYDNPERYLTGDATLEQPVGEIDVSWLSGNIDIVYADIPGVRIHEEADFELADSLRMRYYVDDDGCLNIQFGESGRMYNTQKTETLEGIMKSLTIEVPRGTTLKEIDLDMVSTHVRIDSVASRELNLDGVFFDVLANYPTLPGEIDMDGVGGSLNLHVPEDAGMTVEMSGVKKYLNVTSERPTRKDGKMTILGDGHCKIEVDGVNVTLNINKL